MNNDDHDLLVRLGLRPIINATGYASRLGGPRLAPPVVAAMAAAARTFVPIAEMQARASQLISDMIGVEAACVASGADACLALAAAACMTRDDRAAMDQLPYTTGLRNEIVVHRAQRTPFDHALRLTGARFVEFGYLGPPSGVGAYEWQLHAAFSERTAASFYVEMSAASVVDFRTFARISHEHDVPVIVDAAVTPLPFENLRRWFDLGADLIAGAGGKYLCGPAATGFLAGRRDLVRAATMQQQDAFVHPAVYDPPLRGNDPRPHEPPHQGIGRVLKVGREELAGFIAALQLSASRDYEAERKERIAVSQRLSAAMNRAAGKSAVARCDDPANAVVVSFASPEDATWFVRALQDGAPRVFVGATRITQREITVSPWCVSPEEVAPLEDRLVAVLASLASRNP